MYTTGERGLEVGKKDYIEFEGCLKQSTPGAKPIKFGPEGEAEITLEADASQMAEVKKLVGCAGIMFKITMEVC